VLFPPLPPPTPSIPLFVSLRIQIYVYFAHYGDGVTPPPPQRKKGGVGLMGRGGRGREEILLHD